MDCYQHVALKPQAIYIYQDTMSNILHLLSGYILPPVTQALTLEDPEATT